MVCDRKNQPVKTGDIVLIPAIVEKVEECDVFHNIVVQTVEAMHPAEHKTTILLNSRQVEVVNPTLGVLVVNETPSTTPTPGENHVVP